MRILFTSVPGQGHLQPMLPLAHALESRGHSVGVAIAPELCARVAGAGLTPIPAGQGLAAWMEELGRRHPSQPWNDLTPDQILQWFFPHLFGEVGTPAMLTDLLPLVREWRPDLLIHETYELAGPISARVAGVPSVHHTLGPLLPLDALRLGAESVAPLRHRLGLDSVAVAGDDAALCLDISPPSLRNPEAPTPASRIGLRPEPAQPNRGEAAPPWLHRLSRRPLVHATLGTAITNQDQSVLATVIAGLRDSDIELAVTVGAGHDPVRLGPQPDNVRVERYIAQALLLPHCALVVSHGGSGTMLGALSCGVPLLTIPQGADQYVNAHLCARRGVGRTLLTSDLTPASVLEEVGILLRDPAYAQAAREVQAEIAAMPSAEQSAATLEHLRAGVGSG